MFGVITLATSKGGVGKSSLGRSLAAHWFTIGHRPALIVRASGISTLQHTDAEAPGSSWRVIFFPSHA